MIDGHGTARRLVSGSALRALTLITGMLIAFYMMPFLVGQLGDRWYGFWTLAASIVGYYSILDLGLALAAHRFLAMSFARGDREETNRVFTTALALFTAGGAAALVLTGAMWISIRWLVVPEDVATVRTLVLLLGFNFAVGFPISAFHGVIAATLRFDLASYLQISRALLRAVLVFVGLRHTPSVVLLAAITLGVDMLFNLGAILVARHLWPWLRVSRRLYDATKVREFFRFGFYAFLIRVGDMVRFSIDAAIVAAYVSVSMVTHFGIAASLADYFKSFVEQASSVVAPVFSRYHGLEDHSGLVMLVRQASRLTVAFAATVAGGVIIFGGVFIRRWMGAAYLDAYLPLVILVVAILLGVMQTSSTSYLLAVGRHKYYAVLNGLDALANLALSIFLASRYGMIGVAVGTLVPALIVKGYLQPKYVCEQLGITVSSYWAEMGGVFIRTAMLQLPIFLVVWAVDPQSYAVIGALALGLYSIHGVLLLVFGLGAEDQIALAGAVPALERLVTWRRPPQSGKSGPSA